MQLLGAVLWRDVHVRDVLVLSGADDAKVNAIGILTCDRPELLARALESYAANATRHGADCTLVVMDDSRDASVRSENRSIARRAETRRVKVLYAGAEEKSAYADTLARVSDVSRELIRFALFGKRECGITTGANQNGLLLHAAGTRFVSADDDMLPCFACPRNERTRLEVAPRFSDPTEFAFFPDRQSVLTGSDWSEESVTALHAHFLGQSTGDLTNGASGRVVATLPGIVGDSGMYSPIGLLCTPSPETKSALLRGGDAYRLVTTSREVLRVASAPTLARTLPLMSGSLGIDATTLLPPFHPVLRNQDGIWGASLDLCVSGAHAIHLPRAMLHAPPERRGYSADVREAAGASRQSFLVLGIARTFRAASRDTSNNLRALGGHMRRVAAMPPQPYQTLVRDVFLQWAEGRARLMEHALDTAPNPPNEWKRDVHAHRESLRHAIDDGTLFLPGDLADGRSSEETLELSRVLVSELGKLFTAWPDLFEAAKSLRARGTLLARDESWAGS